MQMISSTVYLYKFFLIVGIEAPPNEPLEAGKKTLVKKEICKRILTSYFFEMHSIDWVDMEQQEIRQKLQNDKREIFFSMFEEYEVIPCYCSSSRSVNYEYKNRYKLRQVRVHGSIEGDEYGFICVGKDRTSGSLKEYFVSQAYNVNSTPLAAPIAGRFVFPFNISGETLELIALAEYSAFRSTFLRIARVPPQLYESTRRSTVPGE